MKKLVLDTSTIIAFLEDLPGAEQVQALFEKAVGNEVMLLIPVTTWSAVCSHAWEIDGRATGEQVLRQLRQLPLTFVEIDQAIAKKAAEITFDKRLPLLTSLSVAVAWEKKAVLVTVDHLPLQPNKEFKTINLLNVAKGNDA